MIKFENQKSFEQYIISSKLKHSVFLINVNNDKESREIISKIKETLPPTYEKVNFKMGKHTFEQIVASFDAPSLFADGEIIEIEGVEGCSSAQIELLSSMLSKTRVRTFFILTASKHIAFSLQGACILDLLVEKPWEHKKRVMGFGFDLLRKVQKTMKYEHMERLVEIANQELATCLQYLELLICYTGGRKEIEADDFAVLPAAKKKQKNWQQADVFIFGEGNFSPIEEMNEGEFYPFIAALRGRLQMGIKIKEGIKIEDMSENLISRYVEYASSLPKSYFTLALSLVYQMEFFSRNGGSNLSQLCDILYVKLKELREHGRAHFTA